MGSDATDPLKAHQTIIFGCKGFWMTPSNTSESVSLKNLLAGQIFIASKHLDLEERITTC